MPLFLRHYGPAVAFGIPGVLMFIATFIFWLGRRQYVRVPPTRGEDPDSFYNVARTALATQAAGQGRAGLLVAIACAVVAGLILLCGALRPALWPEDFAGVISACVVRGAVDGMRGHG